MIQLERVYDAGRGRDGTRFLVEPLWPRAVNKSSLKIESWLRDVAPGTTVNHINGAANTTKAFGYTSVYMEQMVGPLGASFKF